jgi:hypothetical protein
VSYRSAPRSVEPPVDEIEIRRRWGGVRSWWWLVDAVFGWLALFGAYLLTLSVIAPALPWLVARLRDGLPSGFRRAAALSLGVARAAAWVAAAIGLFALVSVLRGEPEHWRLAMRLAQPAVALGALALALVPSQIGAARGMPTWFAPAIWGAVAAAGASSFWGISPSSERFLRSLGIFAALMAALASLGRAWMQERSAARRVSVFHRLETESHEFRALIETANGAEIHAASGVIPFADVAAAHAALRRDAFEPAAALLGELPAAERPAIAAHSDDLRPGAEGVEVVPGGSSSP